MLLALTNPLKTWSQSEENSPAAASSQPAIAIFHTKGLIKALWTLYVFITVLAVAREITINIIGTETVLKDLRHFALDAERSLPSWYENLCFAFAAALLAIIAKLSVENDRSNFRHWCILAVVFFLMSIDAAVSFHEISVKPLRNSFELTGVFYYSWVLIAAPITAAFGLYFLPFLMRIRRETAVGFIIAGTIFVGGALGTEFICGHLASTSGTETIAYRTVAASQEILEGTGLTIFLTVLLNHLTKAKTGLVLTR